MEISFPARNPVYAGLSEHMLKYVQIQNLMVNQPLLCSGPFKGLSHSITHLFILRQAQVRIVTWGPWDGPYIAPLLHNPAEGHLWFDLAKKPARCHMEGVQPKILQKSL